MEVFHSICKACGRAWDGIKRRAKPLLLACVLCLQPTFDVLSDVGVTYSGAENPSETVAQFASRPTNPGSSTWATCELGVQAPHHISKSTVPFSSIRGVVGGASSSGGWVSSLSYFPASMVRFTI